MYFLCPENRTVKIAGQMLANILENSLTWNCAYHLRRLVVSKAHPANRSSTSPSTSRQVICVQGRKQISFRISTDRFGSYESLTSVYLSISRIISKCQNNIIHRIMFILYLPEFAALALGKFRSQIIWRDEKKQRWEESESTEEKSRRGKSRREKEKNKKKEDTGVLAKSRSICVFSNDLWVGRVK